MRIAVIADIHGNKFALKKVLEELDRDGHVSQIYCLGDMIALGLFTNEVLDMLFARKDVSMVLGNHDELVLSMVRGEKHPEGHPLVINHHKYIAKGMEKRFVEPLSRLPRIIEREIEGKKLVFLHYHIPKGREGVHISENPYSVIVDNDKESHETLFSDYACDLIAFGHHHPVHLHVGKGKVFINPGSLGISTTNVATYGIIDIVDGAIHAEVKTVSYDKKEFLESYPKQNIPGYEFILTSFLGRKDNCD
ncbi:MAG TPA: metallophosphoesterase family protein [Clostridiaceae bacterium]|nr:metallophosphoesterase family protein [Clostridiaceae bacterium]